MIPYQVDVPVSSSGVDPGEDSPIYVSDGDPIHKDYSVRQIANLRIDFDKVPQAVKDKAGKAWKGRVIPHRYYRLEGDYEATYDSAVITYQLKLAGEYLSLHGTRRSI